MRRRTLTEELAELERTDPAVAAAAASFDDTVDRLNEAAALHRFRPLPWDRAGQNDPESASRPVSGETLDR